MRKAYMGVRLQRLREERGMTQAALARALDVSASYLNQLERNQRPLTVPLLLRLNAVFNIDVQLFSEDEEARLIVDLREALTDAGADVGVGGAVSMAELRELANAMPAVGRALVSLHRRGRELAERLDQLAAGEGGAAALTGGVLPPPAPYEEVRDFFYARHNHIPTLDEAAERLAERCQQNGGALDRGLEEELRRHDVRVASSGGDNADGGAARRYDPASRVLYLGRSLTAGQRAFQLATQLAFHGEAAELAKLAAEGKFSSVEAARLARIGLANYYAGAVLMPYGRFLSDAERLGYDIDLLAERFGAGFETVCHRLSTLQRPGAPGVPFFFVRVDRAGNMSKRQSATSFHFSRIGGACPLWNVYEAFAAPDRILTQLAQMPDGRTYLWIARTVVHRRGGYGAPSKTFAIGLGCDVRHAGRLVYGRGLALDDPAAVTPIGGGCKVCDRPACPQRAFPALGRALDVDENLSRFEPYPAAERRRENTP